MLRSFTVIFLLTFFITETESQIVTGRLIDETGAPFPVANLQLYASPYVYDTVSDSLGYFSILLTIITGVEDNHLPTGYAVSNNFPNPFNPVTRIEVSLPSRSKVTLEVFNMLGENVKPIIEQTFNPGTNYFDVELDGLSNGVYFSRITIDEKYVAVRKMALVYGSQHLNPDGGRILKSNPTVVPAMETILDSLVVWNLIGNWTFTSLPVFIEDSLNLGEIVIERYVCPPTVVHEGKTYTTVQIGEQCWLKQNINAGTMIPGAQDMYDNGVIEKYCYGDNESNCNSYGGLYSMPEAMQYATAPGSRGICPPGWHIPTREEYEILIEAAGFSGNALKATGQGTGNGTGTNSSGFSALLTGRRYSIGEFGSLGSLGVFWTSTEFSSFYGIYFHLYSTGKIAGVPDLSKKYGFSIRCIKNQ